MNLLSFHFPVAIAVFSCSSREKSLRYGFTALSLREDSTTWMPARTVWCQHCSIALHIKW